MATRKRNWRKYSPQPHHAQELADYSLQLAISVAKLRKSRWMTQTQLARETGIPQTMISYIESGHANPSLTYLVRIAAYFDVPLAQLFESSLQMSEAIERSGEGFFTIPGVGVQVYEITLRDQVTEHFNVAERRQMTVRARSGKAVMRAPYLKAVEILNPGDIKTVPGGGTVKFIGLGKKPAELLIIETRRREGR